MHTKWKKDDLGAIDRRSLFQHLSDINHYAVFITEHGVKEKKGCLKPPDQSYAIRSLWFIIVNYMSVQEKLQYENEHASHRKYI